MQYLLLAVQAVAGFGAAVLIFAAVTSLNVGLILAAIAAGASVYAS